MANPTTTPRGEFEDEGRSARKRRAILDAATTLFLSNGYSGTSMDEVAALARVSKQTVYKHFETRSDCSQRSSSAPFDEVADPNIDEVQSLRDTGDVDRDLTDFARGQLRAGDAAAATAAAAARDRRGRALSGARRAVLRARAGTDDRRAVAAFERLASRGLLGLDDPWLAAAHFNWLVMSIPLNEAMLLGEDEPATAAQLRRYADAGVRAFLAAYRKH